MSSVRLRRATRLTGIACPSRTVCVAVDSAGAAFVQAPAGRVTLAARRLTVTRTFGYALIALRCASRFACVGRLQITTTVRSIVAGHPQVNTVYCFAAPFRIRAGHRGSVKVYADSACLTLLRERPHRLVGQFIATTTSGQRGSAARVTVVLPEP